jgi:ATP-binding cassette subfamily F protein uup
VSHDREFLDHVVTSTLVFEGGGRIGEYAGGYTDWVRQRPAPVAAIAAKPAPVPPPPRHSTPRKRKLSYKEQQELSALPDRIDALETERSGLYASLADPAFLRDGTAVATAKERLAALDREIPLLVERWEALETIAAEG